MKKHPKRKYVKRKLIRKTRRPSTRNFKDPLYKQWRKKVLRRDHYQCAWPGCTCKTKARLNCHHIRKWANYPTLRYDVNNGISLCTTHHKAIQNQEDNYVLFFLQLLASRDRCNQLKSYSTY